MIYEQILLPSMDVFCYILGCERTRAGAVIDPGEDAEGIYKRVQELDLSLVYILNTHYHFDHTGGTRELKQLSQAKAAMHEKDIPLYKDQVDIVLQDKDIISLGDIEIEVIHTPGHTPGGVTFYTQGRLFTGDSLFVGDSGRTDLPYSHRPSLGASIRKLMEFPAETIVCPGHNYGPSPTSTLRQERMHNVNAREYGFALET